MPTQGAFRRPLLATTRRCRRASARNCRNCAGSCARSSSNATSWQRRRPALPYRASGRPRRFRVFELLKAIQADFSVRTACRALRISPSGYYDWLGRKPSRRAQANVEPGSGSRRFTARATRRSLPSDRHRRNNPLGSRRYHAARDCANRSGIPARRCVSSGACGATTPCPGRRSGSGASARQSN